MVHNTPLDTMIWYSSPLAAKPLLLCRNIVVINDIGKIASLQVPVVPQVAKKVWNIRVRKLVKCILPIFRPQPAYCSAKSLNS